MKTHDAIIIGGGPAGWTAALYTARAGLSGLVVAGYASGGQLMTTTVVENYPGFPEGILGPEMMAAFRNQAERFGAATLEEDAVAVDFSTPGALQVTTDSGVHQARAVIVATGASPRMLGVPGEDRYLGRGVGTCAVCDGAHFRGLKVAVSGGGDSAAEEALQLARIASEVHLLVRGDRMRASRVMRERVESKPVIRVRYNTSVACVVGDKRMSGLLLKDSEGQREEPFDGLFVAIGHSPNTAIFRGQLPMDESGYLQAVEGESRTAVPGVFVAGDAFDFRYRQAVTAAASGCKAALETERYLMLSTAPVPA
ncbi:MAG: thioredoxin-disulfide reductase [Armatimonadetes bacterium]|nr:thioredoxin-disulfide reductase [Armatimonadota bacterium]